MRQEKKEEEDLPALRIAWMYQVKDTKKSKETLITAPSNRNVCIRTNRKTPKLQNRNGQKNNCIDTSSDKLPRLHTKRLGYGKDRETSRD